MRHMLMISKCSLHEDFTYPSPMANHKRNLHCVYAGAEPFRQLRGIEAIAQVVFLLKSHYRSIKLVSFQISSRHETFFICVSWAPRMEGRNLVMLAQLL